MNETEINIPRKERLEAIDTRMDEARAAYKKEKARLKEQRRAIQKEWTPQEQAQYSEKKAARAERRAQRRVLSEPPKRPIMEEIGSSVSHGVGAGLSLVALILLIMKADMGPKLFSALVYGLSLLLMFTMSCLYHAFRAGSTVKRIWRRFDYSSIYLLIGGTITPLLILLIGGPLGTTLCGAMWALIAVGVTFVGVFGPTVAKALHFTLFFTIGWSAIVLLPRMWNTSPLLFWLILAGGVVYTLGMIPFARKTRNAHFIWHFFVLTGAALQWLGEYLTVF